MAFAKPSKSSEQAEAFTVFWDLGFSVLGILLLGVVVQVLGKHMIIGDLNPLCSVLWGCGVGQETLDPKPFRPPTAGLTVEVWAGFLDTCQRARN